ncbi:hypothetical protein [Endothiovibrio diazotrophicus]
MAKHEKGAQRVMKHSTGRGAMTGRWLLAAVVPALLSVSPVQAATQCFVLEMGYTADLHHCDDLSTCLDKRGVFVQFGDKMTAAELASSWGTITGGCLGFPETVNPGMEVYVNPESVPIVTAQHFSNGSWGVAEAVGHTIARGAVVNGASPAPSDRFCLWREVLPFTSCDGTHAYETIEFDTEHFTYTPSTSDQPLSGWRCEQDSGAYTVTQYIDGNGNSTCPQVGDTPYAP